MDDTKALVILIKAARMEKERARRSGSGPDQQWAKTIASAIEFLGRKEK